MRYLSLLSFIALGTLALPAAKADLLYTGTVGGLGAASFCCFNVLLHEVSATDVKVTVSLTSGATLFVHTGGPHAGFAFNLSGAAITGADIQNTSNLSTFHVGPFISNGPGLGTFDYYFDNPGNGANANNAGPLMFDVVRASGVTASNFTANAAGYFFAADILNGTTGESAINTPGRDPGGDHGAVPEPTSAALGIGVAAVGAYLAKKKFA